VIILGNDDQEISQREPHHLAIDSLPFNIEDIKMRSVCSDDASQLADFMIQLGHPVTEYELKERIQNLIEGVGLVWVAEIENNIIGFVAMDVTCPFYLKNKIARLSCLIVDSRYQRKGIGKFMLTFAEKFAQNNNCKYLELTSAVDRETAHQFYASLGYKEINDKVKYMSKAFLK
jgi:ribosomal protein S18 acetylase RimI-like enzyme